MVKCCEDYNSEILGKFKIQIQCFEICELSDQINYFFFYLVVFYLILNINLEFKMNVILVFVIKKDFRDNLNLKNKK